VRLADRNATAHRHVSGKTLQEMLAGLMKAGGRVIVCPMCLQNVGGLDREDLLEGIETGGPDVTWPALFAPGTVVLSY
jgi:predicted peroxiredoxin